MHSSSCVATTRSSRVASGKRRRAATALHAASISALASERVEAKLVNVLTIVPARPPGTNFATLACSAEVQRASTSGVGHWAGETKWGSVIEPGNLAVLMGHGGGVLG